MCQISMCHENTVQFHAIDVNQPRSILSMTTKIPSIKVFISSPGDVKPERELVLKTLDNLEYNPFLRDKLDIKPVAWDKLTAGTPLSAKLKPQEAINKGLPIPSQCDIVVVIFWSRMGTPFVAEDGTEYLSGTHWELMDALSNAPHDRVLIYRRMSPPDSLTNVNDPKFDENLAQYRTLQKFFDSELFYNTAGQIQRGVAQYTTLEDFRTLIERDLAKYAKDILDEIDATDNPTERPATPATPQPTPTVSVGGAKTYDVLLVGSPQDKALSDGLAKVTRSAGLRVATLDAALRPADITKLVDQSSVLGFLLTPQGKYAQRLTTILSNRRQTGIDLPWLPILGGGDLQTSVPYGLMSLPAPLVDLRDMKTDPYTPMSSYLEALRDVLTKHGYSGTLQSQVTWGEMTWVDALNLDTLTAQAAAIRPDDAPQVYVSYRHLNKNELPPILHGLRKVGLRVWCDTDSIQGQDWRGEIETAIEQSQVMVALVSEDTIPTSWALEDLAYADAHGKPIIPLALDGAFYQPDAPYPLRQYDIIDWTPQGGPIQHAGNFKKMLDRIKPLV